MKKITISALAALSLCCIGGGALALGNCAVCVFWTRDELMAGGLLKKSKAAMAYASEKGVPLHLAHAWDEESYRFALAQGFCGFQCTCTEIL